MWHITDASFDARARAGGVNAPGSRYGTASPLATRADSFVYGKVRPSEDEAAEAEPGSDRSLGEEPYGQEVGAWGFTDVTFRVRATRALAPVVYVSALVLFVGLYVSRVYEEAMLAATTGSGLASVVLTIVLGLAAVVAATAGTRLLLEFFCNVADLLRRHRD